MPFITEENRIVYCSVINKPDLHGRGPGTGHMAENNSCEAVVCEQDGQVLAEITFPPLPDGSVNIDHIFVDETLRGQGVAGRLMEQTVAALRATGRKAVITCSYAKKWLANHEDARDILR